MTPAVLSPRLRPFSNAQVKGRVCQPANLIGFADGGSGEVDFPREVVIKGPMHLRRLDASDPLVSGPVGQSWSGVWRAVER